MKIRLEIPKARQLPSQGRDADSNSAGSTTALRPPQIVYSTEYFMGGGVEPGEFYRAWADPDKPDAEFVFFVGWAASNDRLVFEDGNGDTMVFYPEEIDIV